MWRQELSAYKRNRLQKRQIRLWKRLLRLYTVRTDRAYLRTLRHGKQVKNTLLLGSVLIAIISSEHSMRMRKDPYALWLYLMKLGASAGCHQRPDRSFFFHGWQFPVCARCTGVLAGQLVGFPIAIKKNITTLTAVLCCETTMLDWSLQYSGVKKSTNKRRLVTGLLGGFGLAVIYVNIIRFVIKKIKRGAKT